MSKTHIAASASAAATPPLAARFSEILAALPIFAWVENSKGKILAHNLGLTTPAAVVTLASKRDCDLPVVSWKITTYALPPIKECSQRLRLVTLVSDAQETDCHARVISALLALLLGVSRPGGLQLTPQQRDILGKLALGHSNKETAHDLGISHDTLRVQLTRMRKRLGDEIIPRRRRRLTATKLG